MLRFKNLAFCDATLLGYKKNGHKKLPYDIYFSIQGKEQHLPWYGIHKRTNIEECWDKRLVAVNKIGSIQLSSNGQGFYFECYLDQSLRRKPELDIVAPDMLLNQPNKYSVNTPSIGWCNQNNPEGFLVPLGIIPHHGRFTADNAKQVSIKVPQELEEICAEYGISSETLFNDLIDNICNFSNSVFSPRADFRSCQDNFLHQLAIAYVRAVYRAKEAV